MHVAAASGWRSALEPCATNVEQADAALRECLARAIGWGALCEQAAVRLVDAMVESGADDGEMIRRLREIGLRGRSRRRMVFDGRQREEQRVFSGRDGESPRATPICPYCLAPVDAVSHFCTNCGGPVSPHATMAPLSQVYSAGWAYRRAISGRPRRLVLAAMWLIFAPFVPYYVWVGYMGLRALGVLPRGDSLCYVSTDSKAGTVLMLSLVGLLLVVHVAILWRVTAQYMRSRWQPAGHNGTDGGRLPDDVRDQGPVG